MAEMKRGRTQVLFRYTPGAAFRYNETFAWCASSSIQMQQVMPLSSPLAQELYRVLDTWRSIRQDAFPDPVEQPHKYEVGEPSQVHFTLAPLVFVCRSCHAIAWYQNIQNLVDMNYRLRCRSCKKMGVLRQVPYGFVHECGRQDTLYVPKHPRDHTIVMIDRGRFRDSFWLCQTCNKRLTQPGRQGLGARFCNCGPKQVMRGTTLSDPIVHRSQTITILDLDTSLGEETSRGENAGYALLGALLRTPGYRASDLVDLLANTIATRDDSWRGEALNDLVGRGVTDPAMQAMMLDFAAKQRANATPGADKQQTMHDELSTFVPEDSQLLAKARESRQLLEYVAVRDHDSVQSRTLPDLRRTATEQGEVMAAERFAQDETRIAALGLRGLSVMEKFPTLFAAVGYSRVFSSPRAESVTRLRPFADDTPKVPIYAVHSTTEALGFELDPWWETAWLLENGLAEEQLAPFADEKSVRLWLLEQRSLFLDHREAHLVLQTWEEERGEVVHRTPAGLFGLLHSVSHVLLLAGVSHVGFEADSISEYLFPVAGAGVLYAGGHEEFTLGAIVSAFRANLSLWLESALEQAQRCIYDPVCHSLGGACHACTYVRFSCPHFNRTVSRSFLIGGPVQGLSSNVVGYWTSAVRQRADRLLCASLASTAESR